MRTERQPFRAAILDLDGTLINSLRDLAAAVNAMLTARGLPAHPLEAFKTFIGDGMTMLVRRALPAERTADPAFLAACEDQAKAEYAARWRDATRPYPGVMAMLDGLTERGLAACILSNKPDEFTQVIMRTMFPGRDFAIVRGALSGVPKKPHPQAALAIAGELGIMPARILILGDSEMDIQTAQAAGMTGVGALWGFRSREELERAGAAAVLDAPLELLDFLDHSGRWSGC